MKSSFTTTGITSKSYRALFRKQISRVKPTVIGMAVAYVSASGFTLVKKILDEFNVQEVRLVTDTGDGVTHPKALKRAVDSGWNVRVVDHMPGTFHPKLYVGGASFDDNAGVADLSLAITGSQNLSCGGFQKNTECLFWSVFPHSPKSAAKAWLDCWETGVPLTPEKFEAYEKYFALCNRYRKPKDLIVLGVTDGIPKKTNGAPRRGVIPPKPEHKVISEVTASVVWAGLQSFTGEYKLQVEFPKQAGLVLHRICKKISQHGEVQMHCVDNKPRDFKYKFYEHNGMFRLNIPNETPSVGWVREHRQGIAYVEYNEEADFLYFGILQPSQPMMDDIVDRSLALGSWGRTPTRLYGWY